MYYIFIIIVLMVSVSCKEEKKSIRPTTEKITESVYASGFIKSLNQYKVYPSANGRVVEVYVKEGDLVLAGTPLFKIHNSTASLNIEQAKINEEISSLKANELKLRELEIGIQNAKLKYLNDSIFLLRQQNLWEKEIGSRLELEQKELAYISSKNLYESALVRLNDLKKQIVFAEKQSKTGVRISEQLASEFIVKSQIKGKVYSIMTEMGEFASVQLPLAILGDADNFIIEMLVDEYDVVNLKAGQKVYVNMDSYKGKTFEAELKRILPLMNERSKSFSAEAIFTVKPEILYPNLSVEANILINTKENALIIPRSYLLKDSFVLKKNGEKTKVETGLKDYQKVEILKGISSQDEIIQPGS
jgi:HlyD family secretion protein